jgi:GNAT superfamily N-acetyltransferase
MRPYVEETWGWDESLQSKGFDEALGASNFKILMADDADVAAYCINSRDACVWLGMMFVVPELQGTGLGKRLMNQIQRIAASYQKSLRLCSIRSNPATELYGSLGYSIYKEEGPLVYFEWGL